MAKKQAAPDAPMTAYLCTSPIEHDGVRIEIGDVVEFPDDIAAPLLAAGALQAPEAAEPAEPVDPNAPPPADPNAPT